MKKEIEGYFFPDGKKRPYWISFDIDGVCYTNFKSTGTPESKGIPIEFMLKFFETFIPESVGMDFTEVNFLLTKGEDTLNDMKTIKVLFDKILDVVHKEKPHYTLENRQ